MDKNDPSLRKVSLGHMLNKGQSTSGHSHHLPHTHILVTGKIELHVNNEVQRFNAPALMHVEADVFHSFVALEDDTFYLCAFPFERG